MKHTVIIKQKPVYTGEQSIPDGAVNGNGDIAIVLGNSGNGLRVYLSKSDFWYALENDKTEGGIKAFAYLDIDMPEEMYNSYYVEQRMDEGEIFARFFLDEDYLEITLNVCATDQYILLDIKSNEAFKFSEPKLNVFSSDISIDRHFDYNGIKGVFRGFEGDDLKFKTEAVAGIRKVSEYYSDKVDREYIITVLSNQDSEDFETIGFDFLWGAGSREFEHLKAKHYAWWEKFYEKSSFSVDDKILEMNWYASQYILACCARNQKFPPGLYGNFITTDHVNWHGDYHLNYNYEAPFYAACSSNHVELTDGYHTPLMDFMNEGGKYAKEFLSCDGIFYPVGLGPLGMSTSHQVDSKEFGELFLGQKSNASYAAVIMIMRYYSTLDVQYAEQIAYPYVKAVTAFWESYLKYEDGRYVIYKDAIHEISYWQGADFCEEDAAESINDYNNILSLGLIRMIFKAVLDMSEKLSVDSSKRDKWRFVLDHISAYPTFEKDGKKIFRYTEKGTAWHEENFLCLQHVYPAGQIGSEDQTLMKVARNTFEVNDRWHDDNAGSSVFPCAVRIGIDPVLILKKLRENIKQFILPNMLFCHHGGCIENNSTAASTLNEMVLQSYEGIIRIFPSWDKHLDCKYENLRAYGAFLVSAEMKDSELIKVQVISEQERALCIENPFKTCKIIYNGDIIKCEDPVIKMDLRANDKIIIMK